MRFLGPALVLSLCAAAQAPAQTLLGDADIVRAIALGEAGGPDAGSSSCVTTAGGGEAAVVSTGVRRDGPYTVTVSGSFGRIAALAAGGRRRGEPLTLDDVANADRAPWVFVAVEPREPSAGGGSVSAASVIRYVVLKSAANPAVVIQPINLETENIEWTAPGGEKVGGNRAVASFDVAAVRGLPAGDVVAMITSDQGPRSCQIAAGERAKVVAAPK